LSRLAAVILAKKLGLDWKSVRKLVDVEIISKLSLAELIQKTKETFHIDKPYTFDEISGLLEMPGEEVKNNFFY